MIIEGKQKKKYLQHQLQIKVFIDTKIGNY